MNNADYLKQSGVYISGNSINTFFFFFLKALIWSTKDVVGFK